MSYCTFFMFASGLAQSILVPGGTLAAIHARIAYVEKKFSFTIEVYKDNPGHWKGSGKFGRLVPPDDVTNDVFCKVVGEHNRFVRWLWDKLADWSKTTPENPPKGTWRAGWSTPKLPDLFDLEKVSDVAPEFLTPEQAQTFWHGLTELEVPPERWSREWYVDRMEHAYKVMRGEESEGVTINCKKPLNPEQAAAVICLFSAWLPDYDMRLDVPKGHDYLASSYDGGYEWCEKCGAVTYEDGNSCRKKACPIRDDDEDRSFVLKDKETSVYLGNEPGAWPKKLTKKVLRFTTRAEADQRAAGYTSRKLTVVPVRRSY